VKDIVIISHSLGTCSKKESEHLQIRKCLDSGITDYVMTHRMTKVVLMSSSL